MCQCRCAGGVPVCWRAGAMGSHTGTSFFSGVTFFRGRWMARHQGQYLGRFEDEEEAAAKVAEVAGVASTEELLLPGRLRHLFQAMCPSYIELDALPADLDAMLRVAAEHREMFQAMPALELWSIQGKYLPWKLALFQAWNECGRPHCSGVLASAKADPPNTSCQATKAHAQKTAAGLLASEAGSGMHLFTILVGAARSMQGADLGLWVANCGRDVSHHSGFLPMLQHLSILRKADHASVPASSSLTLGVAQQEYAVATLDAKLQQKLERVQVAARLLQELYAKPCSDCQTWLARHKQAITLLEQLRPANLTPPPQSQKPVSRMRACFAAQKLLQDFIEPRPQVSDSQTGGYTVHWTLRCLGLSRLRVKPSDAPSRSPCPTLQHALRNKQELATRGSDSYPSWRAGVFQYASLLLTNTTTTGKARRHQPI